MESLLKIIKDLLATRGIQLAAKWVYRGGLAITGALGMPVVEGDLTGASNFFAAVAVTGIGIGIDHLSHYLQKKKEA